MTEARHILNTVFGHSNFRPMQEEVCNSAIEGNDVIAILGTSAGKTICYALPMLVRPGVGIVVSPLKALMFDQVTKLQALGLRAETINSDVVGYERQNILNAAKSGQVDFLYVTPEMVAQPWFQSYVKTIEVSAFGIDEAHCASQYGHDTRPDYRNLGVLKMLVPDAPCIAVTATADDVSLSDMKAILNLRDAKVVKGSVDRKNIAISMNPKLPLKKHRDILKTILKRHPGEKGIVYCLGKASVDTMTDWLIEEGFSALPYHAGLDMMDREINQDRFTNDEVDILVCTVAFGMGIDKDNIRYVIHDTIPGTPESYVQEIGRAGRDGSQAFAYLFYGNQAVAQRRKMVKSSSSTALRKRVENSKFEAMTGICETTACRRRVLMNYFGQAVQQDCGACDNCRAERPTDDLSESARELLQLIGTASNRITAADVISQTRMKNGEASSVLRQLIVTGNVRQDLANMGSLHVTDHGRAISDGSSAFFGNGAFFLETAATVVPAKRPLRSAQQKSTGVPEAKERRTRRASQTRAKKSPLLEELMRKRNSLAREQKVKKFMVLHNVSLEQMASNLPRSLAELLQIKGIGPDKAARYGVTFLNIIREYA